MQTGESILVAFITANNSEVKCEVKTTKKSWTAILDGSSSVLAGNLGNKPSAANKKDVTSKSWPSEAHHLVPYETLKKHSVSAWIKAGKNAEIWGDTEYDVDHKHNGMWLPTAKGLREWVVNASSAKERATNRALLFLVMEKAQLQVHMARHSTRNRYGVGEVPYHTRVNQYLSRIEERGMIDHEGKKSDGTPVCSQCVNAKKDKLSAPRANVIRYVDKASGMLARDIRALKIMVSRIAAEFEQTVGFD